MLDILLLFKNILCFIPFLTCLYGIVKSSKSYLILSIILLVFVITINISVEDFYVTNFTEYKSCYYKVNDHYLKGVLKDNLCFKGVTSNYFHYSFIIPNNTISNELRCYFYKNDVFGNSRNDGVIRDGFCCDMYYCYINYELEVKK